MRSLCSSCASDLSRRLRPNERQKLAGGLEHFLFFHILGIIIPAD